MKKNHKTIFSLILIQAILLVAIIIFYLYGKNPENLKDAERDVSIHSGEQITIEEAGILPADNGNLVETKGSSSLKTFTIRGDSMSPTLRNGKKVIVDFDYYKKNPLQRGDIVVFKFATKDNYTVKRIIALGGDKLEFDKNGNIMINSVVLQEPYLSKKFKFSEQDTRLMSISLSKNSITPENMVLALGDNRAISRDAKKWGLLLKDQIRGKVFDY